MVEKSLLTPVWPVNNKLHTFLRGGLALSVGSINEPKYRMVIDAIKRIPVIATAAVWSSMILYHLAITVSAIGHVFGL